MKPAWDGRLDLSCLGRLPAVFGRNGQFLAAVTTARSQDAATVGRRHSLAEAVLVDTLAVGGLECSFHYFLFLYFTLLGLQR